MAKNDHERTLEELKAEAAMLHSLIEQKEREKIEKQKAEEAAKMAKLAEEKEARRKEIEDKTEELAKLIADYIKDYGSYKARCNDDGILPYLFHMFL